MESIPQKKQLKGLIIGASGAVGRELVKQMCKSQDWSEISIIVRREIEDWGKLEGKEKLRIIKVGSLDEIQNHSKYNFQGYNTVFCTLGSRVKEGEAQFRKVDFTYPVWTADLALFYKIPHYSLCSSTGADHKSWFLYTKVKGEVENELKNKKIPVLSIFRPGALLNRDNDARFGEKLLAYLPFFPKIEAFQCASSMLNEAVIKAQTSNLQTEPITFLYENSDMLKLIPSN